MMLSTEQWKQVFSEIHSQDDLDPTYTTNTDVRNELRDISYVIGLEGSDIPNKNFNFWQKLLDDVVQALQPAPSMTHVELCFPPDAGRDMNFATYLGTSANFGNSMGGKRNFYLGENAPNWRAIPIVSSNASQRMRKECENHVGTPYSIAKYFMALPPFRAFSNMMRDAAQTPAHCAILTARCVRNGLKDVKLEHPSHWYGPSTLCLELDSERNRQLFRTRLADSDARVRAITDDGEDETYATHIFIHGTDAEINNLSESACSLAIHRLTTRSLKQGIDEVAKRIAQKQLATALLRYSIVRN